MKRHLKSTLHIGQTFNVVHLLKNRLRCTGGSYEMHIMSSLSPRINTDQARTMIGKQSTILTRKIFAPSQRCVSSILIEKGDRIVRKFLSACNTWKVLHVV